MAAVIVIVFVGGRGGGILGVLAATGGGVIGTAAAAVVVVVGQVVVEWVVVKMMRMRMVQGETGGTVKAFGGRILVRLEDRAELRGHELGHVDDGDSRFWG